MPWKPNTRIPLLLFLLSLHLGFAFAQAPAIRKRLPELPYQGRMYAYWGYNRAIFSRSDVHFHGPAHDFTLYNLVAHDRPTKFNFNDYFNPSRFTIPQFNLGVGYQLTARTEYLCPMSKIPIRTCPCGSGKLLNDCCGPLLAGKEFASTAEALMRARYTAHTKHEIGFVMRTTHPSTRGRHEERKVRAWAESVMWKRLDILERQKGKAGDEEGLVEFQAWYIDDEGLQCLRERSRFKMELGHWFYLDGQHIAKPKLDGHALCPCGSGEQYKDCCGA